MKTELVWWFFNKYTYTIQSSAHFSIGFEGLFLFFGQCSRNCPQITRFGFSKPFGLAVFREMRAVQQIIVVFMKVPLASLLPQPLQWPHTNGVILRYAASCWNELDSSSWDCGHLDFSTTSCILSVTARACNCNLTASNSAGTSPSAHIHIPGDKDAGE